MSRGTPARSAARRGRSALFAAVVLLSATLIGIVTGRLMGSTRGEAEGALREGVSVFDDDTPAVANLDPGLLRALRAAAADAAKDGIAMVVNSGWRSREYQRQLLRDAIAKYGSASGAARWVAPPDTSAHVSGNAVDIGPTRAMTWLSRHGAGYGLCRVYRNEPWHYELRRGAAERGCPPAYADPTHDPRMHQ
jgi:hypothetical protein